MNGFSVLLYYHFISKKKYRVDEIADKMGIAVDTLYRYVRGENNIPPDRIVSLLKATDEIEFFNYFLDPCGYIPVKRPNGKLFDQPHEKDEIHLSILNGQALEEIEKAHEDGRIDKQEYLKIHKKLTQLQQKAAELAEKIKAEVRG
jgi:transcriptional regulator with XRE-family HTH domain